MEASAMVWRDRCPEVGAFFSQFNRAITFVAAWSPVSVHANSPQMAVLVARFSSCKLSADGCSGRPQRLRHRATPSPSSRSVLLCVQSRFHKVSKTRSSVTLGWLKTPQIRAYRYTPDKGLVGQSWRSFPHFRSFRGQNGARSASAERSRKQIPGMASAGLCQAFHLGKLLGSRNPGETANVRLQRSTLGIADSLLVVISQKEQTSVSVANVVNVAELLNLNSPVTRDQVEALRTALTTPQASEVRQGFKALLEKISGGEASESVFARAGVTAFLLAKHKQAAELLSKVTTDGVAHFIHAQALTSIGEHAAAAQQFENARQNG